MLILPYTFFKTLIMMNKIVFFTLFAVVLMGCNKESLQNLAPNMSATIDEDSWTSLTRASILTDDGISITASSTSGETLILTILGDSAGIYDLNLTSAKCGAVYKETLSQSTSDAWVSSSGQINLTEVNTSDKKISGTFHFQMKQDLSSTVIEISDGVFNNLKYTVSPQ
jgi:hypothetical protein